jgi:hypothetical protein
MSVSTGREIYVLGKEEKDNREVVVLKDGEVHDLPASAKYLYSSDLTKFPYSVVEV